MGASKISGCHSGNRLERGPRTVCTPVNLVWSWTERQNYSTVQCAAAQYISASQAY